MEILWLDFNYWKCVKLKIKTVYVFLSPVDVNNANPKAFERKKNHCHISQKYEKKRYITCMKGIIG